MAIAPGSSQPYLLPCNAAREHSQAPDGWSRQQLPQALGDCYSDSLPLAQDLTLVRSRYHPNRPLIEEASSCHAGRLLVITCALQGTSGYLDAKGSSLAFRAGHTTVSAFQASRGERRYGANETVAQLRLLVGETLLQQYLGPARARQLLGREALQLLACGPTGRASAGHLSALAQPSGSQQPPTLELHIHALSLLSLQLQALAPAPVAPGRRLKAADLERLQRVRDLMFEQMHQPLTVAYLCAAVGLNAFKLKQGLREHYNTTPQRMLLEIRMGHAHRLLEGGCQVAQAAYQVGYRFPGNFSAAFTRFYGKPPKSVFGAGR
ncbi:helix-turn-helix transcriptional regulator [Pseudomonas sp. Au-Pse12]|uniref:helix-turn-helix transcriptional regulator n=1 Tax=Pseudomonas sp. Au-Pse12 TaxID=2906459 RepID=UPI001E58F849|nr:AraC family transcriptional regulator [Pseudomonas sp. Au-Pse12]MCE4057780.1 AraC family transcriptional regulator [Pseudomonas sp. Au-Pse12]